MGIGEGRLSSAEIGELGEQLAALFLRQQGWKLLRRNFVAAQGGEVDLVMRGGKTLEELVFVEVKTRTQDQIGRPLDAVDREKQRLIQRGGNEWLQEIRLGDRQKAEEEKLKVAHRYDVVEVILIEGEKPRVNLVQNAF